MNVTSTPSGLAVVGFGTPELKAEPSPKLECFTAMLKRNDLIHTMKSLLDSHAKFVSLIDTHLEAESDSPLGGVHRYALTYIHSNQLQFEEYT